MKPHQPSRREQQALAEVGHTGISRPAALVLALLFLATLAAVSLLDGLAAEAGVDGRERRGARVREPWGLLAAAPAEASAAWREGEPFRAYRLVRGGMKRFEEELEDRSLLREWLLPPAQELLGRYLGLGNEQAYLGHDGWLFYRPDVDYVTGEGFLDPAVLARRARGGDLLEAAPQPDPVAALLAFHADLDRRGIRLLVMPTPAKPMIEGDALAAGAGGDRVIHNPSFPELVRRLEEAGVDVYDPAPDLLAAKLESGERQFLRTDTHWTPAAVEEVARELARRVGELAAGAPPAVRPAATGYVRRQVAVEHLGDVAAMLRLAPDQRLVSAERVTLSAVVGLDGRIWKPDRGADVLLLGDSFSNIYSDPALGWGTGAGLPEQLSYRLQRPVDRIAMNAGGAYATRQALAQELAAGNDRLAGKRMVVYQFAVRELASGDWRRIGHPR